MLIIPNYLLKVQASEVSKKHQMGNLSRLSDAKKIVGNACIPW